MRGSSSQRFSGALCAVMVIGTASIAFAGGFSIMTPIPATNYKKADPVPCLGTADTAPDNARIRFYKCTQVMGGNLLCAAEYDQPIASAMTNIPPFGQIPMWQHTMNPPPAGWTVDVMGGMQINFHKVQIRCTLAGGIIAYTETSPHMVTQ